MIDLHSHYLPGIDDGSKDMKMSIEMLRQAEDLGIKHLLATPHINELTTEEIQNQIYKTFTDLEIEKDRLGIKVKLSLAGEIHYDGEIFKWLDNERLFIGSKKKYIIFELPIQGLPLQIEDTIFKMGLKGVIPILAHPERNAYLQRHPSRLSEWIDLGCIMQMNAGSITGRFGTVVKNLSRSFLEKQLIHSVCSDAHDLKKRSYKVMPRAYEIVKELYGDEYADTMFIKNPKRILDGNVIDLPVIKEKVKKEQFYDKWLHIFKLRLKHAML